jgi:hypothetical protein
MKCKFLVRVFASLTACHMTLWLNVTKLSCYKFMLSFCSTRLKKEAAAAAWQRKARAKRMVRTEQEENDLMGINASHA